MSIALQFIKLVHTFTFFRENSIIISGLQMRKLKRSKNSQSSADSCLAPSLLPNLKRLPNGPKPVLGHLPILPYHYLFFFFSKMNKSIFTYRSFSLFPRSWSSRVQIGFAQHTSFLFQIVLYLHFTSLLLSLCFNSHSILLQSFPLSKTQTDVYLI